MNYISKWAKGDPEDPTMFFHFERFNDLCGDFIFIAGVFDFEKLDTIPNDKKIVYFDLEEPNRFFTPNNKFNRIGFEKRFSAVLSICPYTTQWVNERDNSDSQKFVFIPFNEELLPSVLDNKIYDINYSGGIHSDDISGQINSILKYKYRVISRSDDPRVTDRNTSYQQKLDIISKSKISLIHNELFLKKHHIQCVKSIPYAEKNLAFKNVFHRPFWSFFNKAVRVPQIKMRTIEAAFCKSLILCRRDDFNVIENFFEPEKEFIYYTDQKEMELIIKDVLSNYEKYRPIVENAFNRAINQYTTKHFVEKYLSAL